MRGNHYYKRLGEQLFVERSKKKFSQEKLAMLSDIDRTFVARIEEGKANPTFKTLYKIARALKIKLSRLLKTV